MEKITINIKQAISKIDVELPDESNQTYGA
jgi:hypothetical protein